MSGTIKINSDCKNFWVLVSKYSMVCKVHNKTFSIKDTCPLYTRGYNTHPLITTGKHDSKNNTCISSSTSNSQAITSNSQGDIDLKRRYVRKAELSIWERLHNYGVKLVATIEWSNLFQYEEKFLRNNVSYKRVDFDDAIVKVFKKSILVTLRAKRDISGLDIVSAQNEAVRLVKSVVDRLPKAIRVSDDELVSVHNAFVNHPTAKLFKQAFGRDMNIKDNYGETHILTDTSKGRSELEFIKKEFVIPASERREQYEWDIYENSPDFPSVQDKKINYTIDVLKEFAEQFKLHSLVQQKQSDNLDRNANIQEETLKTLKSIRDAQMVSGGFSGVSSLVSPVPENVGGVIANHPDTHVSSGLTPISPPPTISKYDVDVEKKLKAYKLWRARELLSEYGWSLAKWQ